MRILVACEESQTITKELRKLGHEAFSCDLEPCSGGYPEWHLREDALIVAGAWKKVVFADECIYEDWDDDREMPICPECEIEYAECKCPGPTQDDIYEYTEIDGKLYARLIEREKWDMMIAHPPCTYLSVSGLHWNKRNPERAKKTEKALDFVKSLMNAPIEKIAIENPVSCISSRIRKPDQVIQPYEFGEDASKKTCLWLKNLPLLTPTEYAEWERYRCRCGYVFEEDLGKYGCPNCAAAYGPAKPMWNNQTPSGRNKLGPSKDRAKIRSKTYPGIARAMAEQWDKEQDFTLFT